ncbi:hypothetical protein Tco_0382591 [Tanacetum coccineum]
MVAYLEKSDANADFAEIVNFLNASPIRYALTSSEPTNLDADEAVHEERGDSVERVAATAASLDAKQHSGGSPRCQEAIGDTIAQTRSERVYTPSYDSPLLGVNTPGSDEERIELKELMDMCTKQSDRVHDLENVKDAQALEIKKKEEDDAEKAELKACLEIVLDDDSAVNIESLATKYPIVNWKTHILANDIIYYQIIRG